MYDLTSKVVCLRNSSPGQHVVSAPPPSLPLHFNRPDVASSADLKEGSSDDYSSSAGLKVSISTPDTSANLPPLYGEVAESRRRWMKNHQQDEGGEERRTKDENQS